MAHGWVLLSAPNRVLPTCSPFIIATHETRSSIRHPSIRHNICVWTFSASAGFLLGRPAHVVDPLSIGSRSNDAILFHEPSDLGLALPSYHSYLSAGSNRLAILCSVMALAGRSGCMADREGTLEGQVTFCPWRFTSLFILSRFQSTVGGISL